MMIDSGMPSSRSRDRVMGLSEIDKSYKELRFMLPALLYDQADKEDHVCAAPAPSKVAL